MTITLTREEAQQVLDALECMNEGALNAEIKLLRARLSAPEPEPVAWMNESDIGRTDWKVWAHGKPTATIPLYAAECMPDDLIATYEKGFADGKAKSEWQGLTDEEILEEYRQSYGDDGNLTDVYFARAIEAKLKEKNRD